MVVQLEMKPYREFYSLLINEGPEVKRRRYKKEIDNHESSKKVIKKLLQKILKSLNEESEEEENEEKEEKEIDNPS